MKVAAALVFGSLIGFAAASEEKQTVKDVLGSDVKLVQNSMEKVVQQMATEMNLDAEELQKVADDALASLETLTPEEVQKKMEALLSSSGGLDGQTVKLLEEILRGSDVLADLGAVAGDKTSEDETEKTETSEEEGTTNADSE